MRFDCRIGQDMLNLVINCCKLLKVNQAAERAFSFTFKVSYKGMNNRSATKVCLKLS